MKQYYQPEIETMPREQLHALQSERLVKQIRHVWENVPYYRQKMEEKGVTPEDIHGIEDLHKLPFLSKSDLRDAYPYGLLAEPLSACVRIQSTSARPDGASSRSTRSMISIFGRIVAPAPSSPQAAQTRTFARFATAMACSQAAPALTAARIKSAA